MQSTSTLLILKSLSLAELKRFGDFVKSPYHNSTSSLEIIYDAVLKSYPDFNSRALSYENMSKKIFPQGENKEKRIKNLYAEFGNLLRKYLGIEELIKKKEYELDVYIAEGLSRKSLFDESEKFIKKSLEVNNKSLLTDSLKYSYMQRMNVQSTNNISHFGEFDKMAEKINERTESMIVSFFREIYSAGNSDTFTQDIFGLEKCKNMNFDLLDSIDINKFLERLKESNSKYYSYIKINYLLYYYAGNDINEKQFYELKNLIFETIHKIEKWEAYTIIMRISEIILGRLVTADRKYNNDLFEFYKLFCELKIFPDHAQDYFHVGMFRDIFNPALSLKEYDWAENFVTEYSQYLSEEIRENEVNYCRGVLNFKRGRYEDSLKFFSNVKPDYIITKINVRFYYILNYIELKAYESARAAVHAFKQFYKDNDEIPEFCREGLPEALKYLSEIIKCEEEGKKIDDFIYNEAHNGIRFFHSIYIKDKMEKLR